MEKLHHCMADMQRSIQAARADETDGPVGNGRRPLLMGERFGDFRATRCFFFPSGFISLFFWGGGGQVLGKKGQNHHQQKVMGI